uniref:type I-F CRISPR-associated protein Csy2 n=1 Tax=Dialister sp. TaxID=1955814 RepID=UPI004024D545
MTYLLLPEIEIQNANALSSLCTIGFPAMTAWMGAVHALERKVRLTESLREVRFISLGVISHESRLQVYKNPGDYHYSIAISSNPLRKKGGNTFERPPFIEDPRIHLKVSLLIECRGVSGDNKNDLLETVGDLLPLLKMAGGDVLTCKPPAVYFASEDKPEEQKKILHRLMPGFAVIERRHLLEQAKNGEGDTLDTLLSFLMIHHEAEINKENEVRAWTSKRKEAGWLIPLVVGFQGLSRLGKVKAQRDPNVLHRFAEPVITLGEFKMPYRFASVEDLMWHYEYDEGNDLYICKNEK